jgi:leader peptidase (prepilin peptidase) / N-methyltransferase
VVLLGFCFGLIAGSFLACCVYRLPRHLSLLHPRRSFCPACKTSLRWYHNIPVVSWLALGRRCAYCQAPISPIYAAVELLSGVLFAGAAWRFPFPIVLGIWAFSSFLIVASFVDFEFHIIPDVTSKGGALAGLLCSLLLPGLQQVNSPGIAVLRSVTGLALGVALLWIARIFGQVAFGRYRVKFQPGVTFRFDFGETHQPEIKLPEESIRLSDYLIRKSDRIRIDAASALFHGRALQNCRLDFFSDRLQIGPDRFPLAEVGDLHGELSSAELPRESMGLGDLKLIGAIGAFTGWPGALFTIPAASFLGLFYGLTLLLSGQRSRLSQIPFGPFLAAAALIWVFAGNEIWNWYLGLIP